MDYPLDALSKGSMFFLQNIVNEAGAHNVRGLVCLIYSESNWRFQPISKICSLNLIISPIFRAKNKKHGSNHHLFYKKKMQSQKQCENFLLLCHDSFIRISDDKGRIHILEMVETSNIRRWYQLKDVSDLHGLNIYVWICIYIYMYLEPETSIHKWKFQLDDLESLPWKNSNFTVSIHFKLVVWSSRYILNSI